MSYIHTDVYSGYNELTRVKRCLCYTDLCRAFVDAPSKDGHNPETSKYVEAIPRLNRLFDIEAEMKELFSEQKKKEHLIREKSALADFWR